MKIKKINDYYELTLENENDVEIISYLLLEFSSFESIEEYKKYLGEKHKNEKYDKFKIFEHQKVYNKFHLFVRKEKLKLLENL